MKSGSLDLTRPKPSSKGPSCPGPHHCKAVAPSPGMSKVLVEDQAELETLLKKLLRSTGDRISGAPSAECAEQILLHLEETDKNFHNYEFVKFLWQHMENSLGNVVEEETKKLTRGDGQHAIGPGHDILIEALTCRTRESAVYQQMLKTLKGGVTIAVESLINKFEEDQRRELHREKQRCQFTSHYNDDCSDSGDSFNQSYAFIRQEQLQVLVERLDPSRPTEERRQALQVLCAAPPSDVLTCDSWSLLLRNLCAALTECKPYLSDHVLQFFAKSFSSSPLNVTREIYTSLAKSVESTFRALKLTFPSGSIVVDVDNPEISSLLKQIRLMNDFQKEVTNFWIRHPEKYMEEVIESTFSLLAVRHEHGSAPEETLEPVHLLALLDVKAEWFNKWMHGFYSRTVVLRLLKKKYKSLVVAAVQQCMLYQQAAAGVADTRERLHAGAVRRAVYTGQQLQYAYFVHSLCLLGKLFIYQSGRRLFPIRLRTHKDAVGLTDTVVTLINIMCHHAEPLQDEASHTECLWPSVLVMEVLWMLCERTECAAECLHQAPVMETLLAPVRAQLAMQQGELTSPTAMLTLVADALAHISNTDGGLMLLLHGGGKESERLSAAHVVVQLTLRLLVAAVNGEDECRAICGAFVFLCRQMYNTCEGLQVLRPYGLHKALTVAWKKTSSQVGPAPKSDQVPTLVPGAAGGSSSQNMLVWEETLLDSLLSFSTTPKGVLLLQQTGAINDCVSYMFSRFTKKLQVSRCEKFGYGVMVTQVAATALGVAALRRSGFVEALVVELWAALECGREDVRMVRPNPTPMEPIDRSCLEPFLSLVNLLSSSQSMWELVGQQPLSNKTEYTLREMPSSIPDLIDRLIAVHSDGKIHSLLQYEQSHTFGLRLLSVLCCNLDSLLLLESQYDICSTLLQSQEENISEQSLAERQPIIDGLSMERNHVLVRAYVVGGPSERRLPPRALQEGEDPYPWPMFSCYPPPPCYALELLEIPQNSATDPEIAAFLVSSAEEDGLMERCRMLYRQCLIGRPHVLTGNVLADFLEKVVVHLSGLAGERLFPWPQRKVEERSVTGTVLSSVETLGINMCLRYGVFLRLVGEDAADHLTLLMKQVKSFLSPQRLQVCSPLASQQDGYPGHDWLTSTVFLMMAGDVERTLSLLLALSCLLTSAFIWPARIHASVHVPADVAQSGIGPIYWSTAHYVEMLVKAEVPLVHSAFKMSGFTPSQMCLHWLTQCFWNYLDWPEICHYISTCMVMGPDYQVYLCVSLFKHLQSEILRRTHSQELQVFLKEEPIRGFKFSNYMEFMEELEKRYRDMVLTDMKSIHNPAE